MRPYLSAATSPSSPEIEAKKRDAFVAWAQRLERNDPAAYKVLESLLGTMAEQARLIVKARQAQAEAVQP